MSSEPCLFPRERKATHPVREGSAGAASEADKGNFESIEQTALSRVCSASKHPVSYEPAESVLILTYVFIGEMIRLPDTQPVTKLHKI